MERREPVIQLWRDDLEQTLRGSQVIQAVLAEVAHVPLVQGRLAEEVAGCLRDEDLSRVRGGPDAGRAADPGPGAALPGRGRLCRVDADPEAAVTRRGPLDPDRSRNGVARAGERDDDGGAAAVYLEAAVLPDDRSHGIANGGPRRR